MGYGRLLGLGAGFLREGPPLADLAMALLPQLGVLRRRGSGFQGIVRIDIVAQIVWPAWDLGVVLVD